MRFDKQSAVACDVRRHVDGLFVITGALAGLLSLRMQDDSHPHHANWAGLFGLAPAFDPDLPPRPVEMLLRCCCLPCCPRSTLLSPPASGAGEGEHGPAGGMVLEEAFILMEVKDPLHWCGSSTFLVHCVGTGIQSC